jgi:uncharacterized protein with WD repeat
MSEFAKASSEDSANATMLPATKLLIRGRNDITGYYGPPSESGVAEYILRPDPILSTPCTLRLSPIFSPDGQFVCLVRDSPDLPIILKRTDSGEIYREIPCTDAHSVDFSPLGSYLVTWSPRSSLRSESETPNLKIWNTETGEAICGYVQKKNRKDTIQWTDDEGYFFKLVTNEVQIFSGSAINEGIKGRIQCKSVSQFKTR